jgi:hypothetical protein
MARATTPADDAGTGRFVSGQRESSQSRIDKVMSEFTVLPRASGDVFAS